MMQEVLTLEDFRPYVDDVFLLHLDAGVIETELTKTEFLRESIADDGRDQFSLIFRGPPSPRLSQHIYKLSHPNMGTLELFLVPVGRESGRNHDEDAPIMYEAVFT